MSEIDQEAVEAVMAATDNGPIRARLSISAYHDYLAMLGPVIIDGGEVFKADGAEVLRGHELSFDEDVVAYWKAEQ